MNELRPGSLTRKLLGTRKLLEHDSCSGLALLLGSGGKWSRRLGAATITKCAVKGDGACYLEEYYLATGRRDWQTRIAAFTFPGCS